MIKLKKNTWILIIITALVATYVYFYEIKAKEEIALIEEAEKQVFSFPETEIKTIVLKREEEVLKFVQEEGDSFVWQMVKPETGTASEGAISFLMTQLLSKKIEDFFTISPEQKKDYGLDNPFGSIQFTLNNGEIHQLIIGNPNFDQEFVYTLIQVDSEVKEDSEMTIYLFPIAVKSAIQRPLEEWIQS